MALRNIIAPRQAVQNSQGQPVSGGFVYLYEPGTTTFITAYSSSDLVTPLTQPVRLSQSGRANIWITRDCDLLIEDRNGNPILTEDNANPDALGGEQSGGLVANGSFEVVTTPPVPDSWVAVDEAGSSNAADSSQSTDGANSYRFTSSGVGGGSLTTQDFFPVNDVDQLRVNFDLFSTVAGVRNIVRVEWYDVSFVSISNSDVYDSTANPLTWTEFQLVATPPALARFAKLRLIGIDPSVALAGSTYFDRINVFYPTVVSGIFDNITIQDNEIISTNLNGEIDIRPNGTGPVVIQSSDPVDLTDINDPLNIGQVYPPGTNPHLALDANTIQAKADATTAAALRLNPLGGNLNVYDGAANLLARTQPNQLELRSATAGDPALTDAITIAIGLESATPNAYGLLGFDGSADLVIRNLAQSDNVTGFVRLQGTDSIAALVDVFSADPDDLASMFWAGEIRFSTDEFGGRLRGSLNNNPAVDAQDQDSVLSFENNSAQFAGAVGFNDGTPDIMLLNQQRGGRIELRSLNASGIPRTQWLGDPDTNVQIYHPASNAVVARTETPANGGLEVDNQSTGAGFERVLTTSDLGIGIEGDIKVLGQTITGSALTTLTSFVITITGTGNDDYYHFYVKVPFRPENASYGNVQWNWLTAGTGPNFTAYLLQTLYDTGAGNLTDISEDSSLLSSGSMTPGGAGNNHQIVFEGWIRYNGTIGQSRTIELQMARTGAAGNTVVLGGAEMKAYLMRSF